MNWFSKYTFRQKNFALLIIFGLLLMVTYKRALNPTLESLDLRSELTEKRMEAQLSLSTLKIKRIELSNVNKLIGQEGVTTEKVQQGLLSFHTSRSQDGVNVSQIDEPYYYIHPDFYIYTNQVTLKGDFHSLHKFIFDLETEFDLARVVSIKYYIEKNYIDSREELYATLLLQNFEKNE